MLVSLHALIIAKAVPTPIINREASRVAELIGKAKIIVPIRTTAIAIITGISIPYLSTITPTGIFIISIAMLYIDIAKAMSILENPY